MDGEADTVIDPERLLSIACGLLLFGLLGLSLALVSEADWRKYRDLWQRIRHYWSVHWQQMDETDRAFWTWLGRTVWLTVLVGAGLL